MKLSSKIQKCGLSPMRKFYPCEVAAEARGLRVHHLNIGQPDIETPKAFFDAARSFGESVLAYAPAPGVEVYLEAVRDYYGQLGYPLTCDEILATYGGSEALQIVLSCILDEGDEILIPEPYYPNYDTFVRSTGGVIRPIPTTVEEGYRYADRAKIEPLINAHTRAILITNPGNPTGVVLSAAERRLMVDIAREHDLFLISDEVYREIVYGAEVPSSMLEFADAAENVAVVDSVSKRFSATGARVGALLSRNRELMDEAMKICQGRLCAATLDQVAAAAMYRQMGPEYYKSVLEEYRRRKDALVAALKKQKLAFDYATTSDVPLLENKVHLSYESRIALIEGDEHITSLMEKRSQLEFYRPHIAVLTNLKWNLAPDHDTPEAYMSTYRFFSTSIEREGKLIYYGKDPVISQLVEEIRSDITAIPFDQHEVTEHDGQTFLKTRYGEYPIQVKDTYFLINLNAARMACRQLGVKDVDFYKAVSQMYNPE